MPFASSTSQAHAPARPAPRAGRPRREDAQQLRERILDAATDLLFAHGYGATSIEAVARSARVSKRTFYSRFGDKSALITAVVVRLIDSLRPPSDVPLIEGQHLREILTRLGSLILHAALSPKALQLQRLVVAESKRFPDLAIAVAKAGGRQEAVALISQLLTHHLPQRTALEAQFAAQQFLQMIVSYPQLRALGVGTPLTPAELDAWVSDTADLFLRGVAG